ncbi:hypothetical protein [Clostridium coskatii]|uniref:Uncharacterized protein n=1 Tax=Clostridium coskatii TaxID=1705578 RepID=A0A166RYF5_9CLOT|nr:hypothetical protein [Clostridium coskatii]OAA91343.1 hypothetical protein WX73_01753 [Clostridium coskatii]OBR93975.1 hypothetical protein CLCOS_21110 [Clostridium coskatii]
MNTVIVDLTPNRHFCNLKIKCISEHLNGIGLNEVKDNENKLNEYVDKSKSEKLVISENGELSLEFVDYEVSEKFIESMIEKCKIVLRSLEPDYKSKLSDDTFYIYWPDDIEITSIKEIHDISDDYIIKTYEILDNVYSSIVQKKYLI